MALSAQSLRLPSNNREVLANPSQANVLRALVPENAAPCRRRQCGGRVLRLSAGQARAVLQATRPAPQREPEFRQERPESWSKAQRALVESTVDLGNLDVTPERRAEIVKQVRAGGEKGLFFVKNFGVDLELLNDIRRVSARYFAQPMEEKLKTKTDKEAASRFVAYHYKFSVATDGNIGENPGYREAYRLVCDPELGRKVNCWPPAMPEFKEKFDEYTRQIQVAVKFMAGLFAEGLGLPESYFTDKYGRILYDVLLCSSPPQVLAPGQIASTSLPAHSDPNFFNFNMYDGNRGVQFFTEGEWLTVPALVDRVLVNLGDDMETMSNGIYHASYHRVVTGPRTRFSMITTCETAGHVVLEPAQELIDDQNPARYVSRRRIDRLERIVLEYRLSLKPDRTKAAMFINPDQDLDKSKNIYTQGGKDYICGVPVLDWKADADL